MKVIAVEDPSTVTSYAVWISSDGADWGSLRDDVYPDRVIKPNQICVVVRMQEYAAGKSGRFWADWSQARETRASVCAGTHEHPQEPWARKAEELAVDTIRLLQEKP